MSKAMRNGQILGSLVMHMANRSKEKEEIKDRQKAIEEKRNQLERMKLNRKWGIFMGVHDVINQYLKLSRKELKEIRNEEKRLDRLIKAEKERAILNKK